jgi:hypothetical protein
VILDVLAVFHRGRLGFLDRAVGLDDRDVFLRADGGVARAMLEVPARVAQVGQRVQVGGVRPGRSAALADSAVNEAPSASAARTMVESFWDTMVSFRGVVVCAVIAPRKRNPETRR